MSTPVNRITRVKSTTNNTKILQSMKLEEAYVEVLKILKQVMEEKLNASNIEVALLFLPSI